MKASGLQILEFTASPVDLQEKYAIFEKKKRMEYF